MLACSTYSQQKMQQAYPCIAKPKPNEEQQRPELEENQEKFGPIQHACVPGQEPLNSNFAISIQIAFAMKAV